LTVFINKGLATRACLAHGHNDKNSSDDGQNIFPALALLEIDYGKADFASVTGIQVAN